MRCIPRSGGCCVCVRESVCLCALLIHICVVFNSHAVRRRHRADDENIAVAAGRSHRTLSDGAFLVRALAIRRMFVRSIGLIPFVSHVEVPVCRVPWATNVFKLYK